MQMFRNLRNLSLRLVTSHAIVEIFELSRLLGDFPLLQSLTFVVIKLPITREIRRRWSPSPTRDTELKQVTYGGFNGLDTEMEFVLYILRCAVVLEKVFLSLGYKNDFSLEQKSVMKSGRRHLMEMIQDLSESSIELSLKDIVDDDRKSTEESKQAAAKEKVRMPQQKKTLKRSQISRSESMDSGVFLLKMFLPTCIGSKKKLQTRNCSKVSSKTSVDESEKSMNRDW
ncbi:hypothetical protein T459_29007 [Capsicum annuum]|uniref:FBD domain-containing protein n=1 Tax=Capsicum annuum TaxID=4072 RepID=A0A2G2Y4B6_CAPAN|nr:hypothetical protein T459_29007 [Capsicum annuum]